MDWDEILKQVQDDRNNLYSSYLFLLTHSLIYLKSLPRSVPNFGSLLDPNMIKMIKRIRSNSIRLRLIYLSYHI